MRRDKKVVPALMFHSVGLEDHPWVWSYISESLKTFETKIILLKEHGFTGVFWADVYEHMAGRCVLPDNSILLTFDDGYLDNWVYVYPILKKHGMKGTIFVSPDFVDPSTERRPNLDDVASGAANMDKLAVAGFLNWSEMQEMERSGFIDIQSHAMTHTWHVCGPRVVDIHRPSAVAQYPWLFWNARPDRKPFYMTENQQEYLPWGHPILEHQKALLAVRYFPEESAVSAITELVTERGGREYFREKDWWPRLNKEIDRMFPRGELPGHYESDDERAKRILAEVRNSKAIIEANLGKRVDFICWPGGANDQAARRAAQAVGYRAWTLSSSSQATKRNRPGSDPTSIKRIGTTNVIEVRGRNCGAADPRLQLWRVLEHQGSAAYKVLVKARKLGALIESRGRSI